MPDVKRFLDLLTEPGNILLEGNQDGVRFLTEQAEHFIETEHDLGSGKARVWHLPGTRVTRAPRILVWPTGHISFYGTHGRRILGTDPDGTPLHECAWHCAEDGAPTMTRARIRLDSQQWVGIQPEATEHVTLLDLPPQPQRPELTPDALRQMAARAWQVSLEDLRYFYPDESFSRDKAGHTLVRLKKDGLYLLEDGTFDRARFVSYMGAIPWPRIDLLNVVELYQSTLPGTGGAAFDLIWGLCEDQRSAEGPIALRYRGLPTFPSDQAYGLFCAFFKPEAPEGQDPYPLFMDTQRGYQIAWWPRPDPPWRYFDRVHRLCVTVQRGEVQKVTVIDDPVAVPYVHTGTRGFASCERSVGVCGGTMELRDRDRVTEIPLHPNWGVTHETLQTAQPPHYPFGWRAFFREDPPIIEPVRAWSTALCFPDDDAEVGEESTQLFVLEQAYGYLNQLPDLSARLEKAHWVLVHNFDPVCAGFVDPDNRLRRYTILYNRPEWAQKNAQVIWDRAAREARLESVRHVEFVPEPTHQMPAYEGTYERNYRWIPFRDYDDVSACEAAVRDVALALSPHGLTIVVGPPEVATRFTAQGLRVACKGGAEDLRKFPAMIEHFRIHPGTRVNSRLTVVLGENSPQLVNG